MNKYKIVLVCLIASLTLDSCTKAVTFCGAADPANDISWIKSYIEANTGSKIRIYKITYKATDGFLLESCQNQDCSNYIGSFRNCSNQTICTFGGVVGNSCPDFWYQTTYYQLLYSN